jgi:hypothetical protein
MPATLACEFQYGEYAVYHDGEAFIAESADDEMAAFVQLRSRRRETVLNAVDELYVTCQKLEWPPWFKNRVMIGNNCYVDLDAT